MVKAKGLGRGLDALFTAEEEAGGGVVQLRLSDISPNPAQPRHDFDEEALRALAESIRENGVITPLAVRKVDEGYQIIAGERRWRACRLAEVRTVPALVLDVDNQTAFELALIENLQREDLNPLEEAEGLQKLLDTGMTQEEAAQKVGRSRPAVANALRLLALPERVRELVRDKLLSAGHARTLLSLSDPDKMEEAAQIVLAKELSVRQTEELVKQLGREKTAPVERPDAIYVRDLERTMAAATSHRVLIRPQGNHGKLTVEYTDNEDLERICEALKLMKKGK